MPRRLQLTDADRVWNRACYREGTDLRDGDRQVRGGGVPHAGVPVPQVGVADARSLQEEQVVLRPVVGEPEVPDPVGRQSENGQARVR